MERCNCNRVFPPCGGGWYSRPGAPLPVAALAIWAGFDRLLPFLVAVSILGGALALVLLMFRPVCAKFPSVHWPLSLLPGNPLPYGVAIGGGAVVMKVMFPVL